MSRVPHSEQRPSEPPEKVNKGQKTIGDAPPSVAPKTNPEAPAPAKESQASSED